MGHRIDAELRSLPIKWEWHHAMATGVGFAMENVWSRQARRKRQLQQKGDADAEKEKINEGSAALGFKIQLKQKAVGKDVEVLIRWFKGTDSVLFESFCGMLKRKVEER